MNEFNILYWNINNKASNNNDEKSLNISVEIVRKQLENYIDIYNIDAIILTEAYPCDECNKWLGKGKKVEEYEIFKSDVKGNFNSIIIIAKKIYNFKKINSRSEIIDILKLSNDNISLIGFRRQHSDINDSSQYEELGKQVDENTILIGDFNPGNKSNSEIKKMIKTDEAHSRINIYDCLGGTACNEKRTDTYPDKLLMNDKYTIKGRNDFCRILTPEEIFIKNEYLYGDGHIAFEYLDYKTETRSDNSNHDSFSIKEKYKNDMLKEEYKNMNIINNKYTNTGICSRRFPDHNLLFASIDLGAK